jgi:hypothetical protein
MGAEKFRSSRSEARKRGIVFSIFIFGYCDFDNSFTKGMYAMIVDYSEFCGDLYYAVHRL